MRKPSRRQFVGSVGAGLLLAPFINLSLRRQARAAAANRSSRVLVFCTMGTYPPLWTPTAIAADGSITTWSAMTQPLSAVKANVVLVEGMPSGNINDNHGSSDSLTGQGFGYYGQGVIKTSVDQFIASKLVASGVNRPIGSLLLGANANENGGSSQFYGGATGGNLPTTSSPLSAFTTVFGSALPAGMSTASLLARRQSILDAITGEINTLKGTLGNNETAKMDVHLDSIRQLENKLSQSVPAGNGCTKPTKPGADSTLQYMGDLDAMAANILHQQIIASAFACDITRVAGLEYGNDQRLMVNTAGLPYDDQHGGYIHSGAASNYANLVKFEAYLCTQFVNIINALKGFQDPLDASKTLFDTTLMIWARDMGDAQNHNQQSMRFVLAGGNGSYLKTAANGRYIKSGERHERILLNVCEAMGITSYTGFGDPGLAAASKTPLPGIAA
jgi:Protein of unknown function (DUF1552)